VDGEEALSPPGPVLSPDGGPEATGWGVKEEVRKVGRGPGCVGFRMWSVS